MSLAGNIYNGIIPNQGFYDEECDERGPFVWTRPHFSVTRIGNDGYFSATMCFYGKTGKLFARSKGEKETSIELYEGWNTYALDLSGLCGEDIEFELNEQISVQDDNRALGVMIRKLTVIKDHGRFQNIIEVSNNKLLNRHETMNGKDELQSLPYRLRIDLENRCNITSPCVYCEWDWVKHLEHHDYFYFSKETLCDLGSFTYLADEVVDCSYGEPFMNPFLDSIIDQLCREGKRFEMTSNGQILNRRNRRKILGKPLTLYISIDSPTAKGYRSYRNEGFNLVLDNLRAICSEKKEYNSLPQVFVSYIVMKSNLADVRPFVELMGSIGVDGVKLRSLYYDPRMKGDRVLRNGFLFKYEEEIVPHSLLTEVEREVRPIVEDFGLVLVSELDFLENNSSDTGPICREPWETFYVLKRGIMGCCFSKDPLVEWAERNASPLEDFLRAVWNGPAYRELRSSMAKGIFPNFCLENPSCPIVRSYVGKKIPGHLPLVPEKKLVCEDKGSVSEIL